MKRKFETYSDAVIENKGESTFNLPVYKSGSVKSLTTDESVQLEVGSFGSAVFYFENTKNNEDVTTEGLYEEEDQ